MNHKSVITETFQYIYSLYPKWCYAHFCYQNRWPSMTLNGVMTLILRYFTEFGIVSGAHCVKAVDDKPYISKLSAILLIVILIN